MRRIVFSLQLCVWFLRYFYLETVQSKNRFLPGVRGWEKYLSDFFVYEGADSGNGGKLSVKLLKPCLADATSTTVIEPVYFFQNSWCAGKIFKAKPKNHVDVGSDVRFVSLISQFVPTIMVDIRPVRLVLPGLNFKKGDILNLPFKDNEIRSLSSICVVEHVGLGRYGDSLDPDGSWKAAAELSRVLAKGGNLYVSVPVDKDNKVYFNAHRAFTRDFVKEMFKMLSLVEEKYVYGEKIARAYEPGRGFGTGLFHFTKQ